MVYLIYVNYFDKEENKLLELLKIGYTDNLDKTLAEFRDANPSFILLKTREGDKDKWRYLCKKFEFYQYGNWDSWFYYSQDIVDNFIYD